MYVFSGVQLIRVIFVRFNMYFNIRWDLCPQRCVGGCSFYCFTRASDDWVIRCDRCIFEYAIESNRVA